MRVAQERVTGAPTARSKMRIATYASHEALHAHPVFERLMSATLTPEQFQQVIQVNLRAFTAIEAARKNTGRWTEFSLAEQIRALQSDADPDFTSRRGAFDLPSAASVLGGLYVAHGSTFGAKVISKSIARSLPHMTSAFFTLRTASIWPDLCKALENLNRADLAIAIQSANLVFRHFLQTPVQTRLTRRNDADHSVGPGGPPAQCPIRSDRADNAVSS